MNDNEHMELIRGLLETFNKMSVDLVAFFSYTCDAMLLEIRFKNEVLLHVDASNLPVSQASTILATTLSAFLAGQKYQVLK